MNRALIVGLIAFGVAAVLVFALGFVPYIGLLRWTLPVWLYVSVTGVIVYLLLYWPYSRS